MAGETYGDIARVSEQEVRKQRTSYECGRDI
jgi:hypothetical protein